MAIIASQNATLNAKNESNERELEILHQKLQSLRETKIAMEKKIDLLEQQLRESRDVKLQELSMNNKWMNETNHLVNKVIPDLKEKLRLSELEKREMNERINCLTEEKRALDEQQAADTRAIADSRGVIEEQKEEIENLGRKVVELTATVRRTNAERDAANTVLDMVVGQQQIAVNELFNEIINDVENQIQRRELQHQPRNANRQLRQNDIFGVQELAGEDNPPAIANPGHAELQGQPIFALHVQQVNSKKVHDPH
ncbi:uncharacterized protein LOC114527018 [Dendronephthya gigantea]|uniref:uncharacterized protein LOC114527018 n=1 Tax=Dendronephthya gigantea TaxID=151771 RepID=UPI00106AD0A4|nr:uncharacterized protein LOC114527018 [Dendronephthya gigantea]